MSNELFFGIEVDPSSVYTYNVSQPIQFTMATIKDAKNASGRTLIYMKINNVRFTICSLMIEKFEQQVLNLKVQKGTQIKIWSNGPNSVQLLGTYTSDQDTTDSPLDKLSVETIQANDDKKEEEDIYYYPMTKQEHDSLLQYNSENAIAEREEFVSKFNIIIDILDSIKDPQPILDNFLLKYTNKKRGLEDIEKIFKSKKIKTSPEIPKNEEGHDPSVSSNNNDAIKSTEKKEQVKTTTTTANTQTTTPTTKNKNTKNTTSATKPSLPPPPKNKQAASPNPKSSTIAGNTNTGNTAPKKQPSNSPNPSKTNTKMNHSKKWKKNKNKTTGKVIAQGKKTEKEELAPPTVKTSLKKTNTTGNIGKKKQQDGSNKSQSKAKQDTEKA